MRHPSNQVEQGEGKEWAKNESHKTRKSTRECYVLCWLSSEELNSSSSIEWRKKLVKAFAILKERKANFIFQTCFASRSNFAENFFSFLLTLVYRQLGGCWLNVKDGSNWWDDGGRYQMKHEEWEDGIIDSVKIHLISKFMGTFFLVFPFSILSPLFLFLVDP